MLILQANEIKKSYGTRTVLDVPSFQVYEGDKIGIVGLNGAGKTTLLNILSGELEPDSGHVTRHAEVAIIRQLPKREAGLSGGENAKRMIRQEIHSKETIVFADEPTANLDQDGMAWLRQKLMSADTVLLISHDRELLNAVCTRIVEVKDGTLTNYTGNYADYERKRQEEAERHHMEYERYRRTKEQLEQAVQLREQKVARQRQKKRADLSQNSSEARLGGHKRAASMKKQERIAKVLSKRIERLDRVEKARELPKLSIDFSITNPPGNKVVISCEGLFFSYGDKPVFQNAGFVVKNRAKLAITGKNGAGKSTLLQLIHTRDERLCLAPKLTTGYLYQSFENLDLNHTVLESALADSIQEKTVVRAVLAGLLFRGDDVWKKVSVLSGGEKTRLSLAKLILGNYNCLLLDEPTNYLDIRSIEAVEAVLRAYPGTVLLVSHDKRFRDAVADTELSVEDGKVVAVTGAKPVSSTQKTLLELRRVRLLAEIAEAPMERKPALEVEYAAVVEQLKTVSP